MEVNRSTSIPSVSAIFGSSKPMKRVRELAQRAAFVHTPVFLYGPTGAGKQVLARHIHLTSPWKEGPFYEINCATAVELLETELFGFVEGAFPGASSDKGGLLELADGGTLLLDDISELGLRQQEKLLQVLQDGTFTPIGGRQPRSPHVRIMATAKTTLQSKIDEGCFRRDLFARLSSISICVPSLRERIDDLPSIARYMLNHFAVMLGNPVRPLSSAAIHLLMTYEWPGNIRELENVLFQYALTKASLAPLRNLKLPSGEESVGALTAPADLKPRRSRKLMKPRADGNHSKGLPKGERP